MIRWSCPNGHPAILGPRYPPKNATCRVCLTCSAEQGPGDPLILRVSTADARRDKVENERKLAAAMAATQRKEERKRQQNARAVAKAILVKEAAEASAQRKREQLVDYVVSAGTRTDAFSQLRGKHGALARVAALRKIGREATITRVGGGMTLIGEFHQKRLMRWRDPETSRVWPASDDK